jgi:hypothetical protein
MMLMPETRIKEKQEKEEKQIPIFDTVYVQTPRTESHVDCSNKIRVATNKNCKKENRHSIIIDECIRSQEKDLPLKFPLAAGKQGMAPSRCVYGFRQECVLKSVSKRHYSRE